MRLCLMIEGQENVTWDQWRALAEACEQHGLEGLFRSDHYAGLMGDEERGSLDAWATLAGLAALSERIRLGTMVSPATFRHPSALAKMVTTVDHISGGRVELGLGAGWNEREHRAYGFEFPDLNGRLERFAEQLEIVHRSWTEDEVDFEGRHYRLERLHARPKPVQSPHPALWQTVSTSSSARLAGELGMGILCTTLLSPVSTLEAMLVEHDAGLATSTNPVGRSVNDQRGVFTFVHCTDTVDEAIASRAAEAAMWYVNAAPKVFSVPRTIWTNLIRGNVSMGHGRARGGIAFACSRRCRVECERNCRRNAGCIGALDIRRVREVVPRVRLRPVSGAPEWLAGLFVYRGQAVPVLDLHRLAGAGECPPHLSSRIILVPHGGPSSSPSVPSWSWPIRQPTFPH